MKTDDSRDLQNWKAMMTKSKETGHEHFVTENEKIPLALSMGQVFLRILTLLKQFFVKHFVYSPGMFKI